MWIRCRGPRAQNVGLLAQKGQALGPGHRLVPTPGLDADQQGDHGRLGAIEDRARRRRLDRSEGAGRRGMLLPIQAHHRLTLEDRVDLGLAALVLVVLRDFPAGRDLDQVEAEGRRAERLARQHPGGVPRPLHPLELVAVLDRVAVSHLQIDPSLYLRILIDLDLPFVERHGAEPHPLINSFKEMPTKALLAILRLAARRSAASRGLLCWPVTYGKSIVVGDNDVGTCW